MKRKLLFISLITFLSVLEAIPQLPNVSTGSEPIEYSDEQKSVWYNIVNAEYDNKGITDISTAEDTDKRFAVSEVETDNENQQWKIVQNNEGRVNFINKVSGNIIQTDSKAGVQIFRHNLVQFTQDINQSNGWELDYIENGQYTISGIETDGIIRYLNVGETTGEATKFDPANTMNSRFAWILKKVEELIGTSTVIENNIRIYSLNKCIIVENSDDYTIANIQGQIINKNFDLATGIYLVTVNGKTTKISVK